MTNTHYLSAVLDYLHDEYGVDDAEPSHGGKHPYVIFTHAGSRRRITLGHDGRQDSINLKLQDIRRMLGPPQPKTIVNREKRRLEDMEPKPLSGALGPPWAAGMPPVVAQPIRARVAVYAHANGRKRLRVNVSAAAVVGWNGVAAQRHDADTWDLSNNSASSRKWGPGDAEGFVKVDMYDVADDVPPFGASPAEVVEVDGHLLLTCHEGERVPTKSWTKRKKTEVAVGDIPIPVTSEQSTDLGLPTLELPATPVILPGPSPIQSLSNRARMLAVLREIVALQDATEFRLTAVKDETGRRYWEWRPPPPVRLED